MTNEEEILKMLNEYSLFYKQSLSQDEPFSKKWEIDYIRLSFFRYFEKILQEVIVTEKNKSLNKDDKDNCEQTEKNDAS